MSVNSALGHRPVSGGPTAEAEPAGYWSHRLAEATGVDLATSRWQAAGTEYQAANVELVLPAGGGCPDSEPPGFAVLLAAWYVVLHRHTGQADLLVGTRSGCADLDDGTAAGRERRVIPLRTGFDPAAPFEDLVDRTRDAVLDAVAHMAELDAAQPSDFERAAGAAVRIGFGLLPLADKADPAGQGRPFDAELLVDREGADTVARLSYDASLFSRETAQWLLHHFATVLTEAQRAPHSPVRRLPVGDLPIARPVWPLPTPAGYLPPTPPGPTESLVDRFRATVSAHGNRPAVTGRSCRYTYAELERTASELARQLVPVAPAGSRIALLCEHDTGLAVGIWSVLIAGCAYVPLDPRQPAGRLSRIVTDAKVAAIVCDPDLADRATALAKGAPVIPLAGPAAATDPGSDPTPRGEDIAYLLHTSGSTGRPKAVVQTQGNVLGHVLTYADRIRIGPGDRLPLLARFTFDAAVMDFFGALLSGASLHIVDPVRPGAELWDLLIRSEATILHCTPTLFRHLLAAAGAPTAARKNSIRIVVLGGEEVSGEDLRRFDEYFPQQCALVNGLGPTECTLALQHLVRPGDPASGPFVAVGHPVEGVEVRLLDEDGLPTEVLGEVELLSTRLALGYWEQPEVTSAVFGRYPNGTRYYRTGDLARRTPDGALVYRGRKDRQVKVRGHRLELGEIEALLRAHPSVAQAAVLFNRDSGEARLIAYATSATPVPLDPDELTGYLGRQLPDYAVPALIIPLEAIPLGPTGKLDRSRLPAPVQITAVPAVPPRSPVELAVADIWCRILGLADIGMQANFMASGGDSIRLQEMIAEVEDKLGVAIPLLGFLRSPTIATIAELVERKEEQ
ncbi:MAG TPA: amino acid adenylation domain-containing protein [Pseudonocardiaceae bacterium]|jgi:amino acid adenylation domain-containing protein|nr:amino acid adenylation domain-containing protein [Pseudonocardiaceae bacterium]